MADENYSRLHASIIGRVQGVSFRYYVVEQAMQLDLFGWVRNRWNGSVEVTAEGSRQKLEALLQALREGPSMARVDEVVFEWQAFTAEFSDFELRSTA